MKFGKSLIQAISSSNPQWGPFWINYKALKKRIKVVMISARANGRKFSIGSSISSDGSDCPPELSISDSQDEVDFFSYLRDELRKLSCFYVAEEKRCIFRFKQLSMAHEDLKKRGHIDETDLKRLMAACLDFYKECVSLENFVIINYLGFSKILKKHDKVTGYETRTQYMRKMVNQSPMASHPQLSSVLENIEKLFNFTNGNISMDMGMKNASELRQKYYVQKQDLSMIDDLRENIVNKSIAEMDMKMENDF